MSSFVGVLLLALPLDRLLARSRPRWNPLTILDICCVRVATCLVNASICVSHVFCGPVAVCSVAKTRARLFTSYMRSACSATSCSLSSFRVARMACMVGGSRPNQSVFNSSGVTVVPARVLRCRRNCEGFLSPSSSLSSSCRIRCS